MSPLFRMSSEGDWPAGLLIEHACAWRPGQRWLRRCQAPLPNEITYGAGPVVVLAKGKSEYGWRER